MTANTTSPGTASTNRGSVSAVCRFAPGKAPKDRSDCQGADSIEPVAVTLQYAFTFEIVKGQHVVRTQGR